MTSYESSFVVRHSLFAEKRRFYFKARGRAFMSSKLLFVRSDRLILLARTFAHITVNQQAITISAIFPRLSMSILAISVWCFQLQFSQFPYNFRSRPIQIMRMISFAEIPEKIRNNPYALFDLLNFLFNNFFFYRNYARYIIMFYVCKLCLKIYFAS